MSCLISKHSIEWTAAGSIYLKKIRQTKSNKAYIRKEKSL